jgi:hypothetical protein
VTTVSAGLPMSFFDNKEIRKAVHMTTECGENYIRTKPGDVKETTRPVCVIQMGAGKEKKARKKKRTGKKKKRKKGGKEEGKKERENMSHKYLW